MSAEAPAVLWWNFEGRVLCETHFWDLDPELRIEGWQIVPALPQRSTMVCERCERERSKPGG
jgi:hypothetical protein